MSRNANVGVAQFGPWSINFRLNRLMLEGVRTPLPPKSMAVLAYLLEHNDRFVSADELLGEFWAGRVTEESTIHRRINLIRSALGDNSKSPKYIENAPRQGYRFIAKVQYLADEPIDAQASPAERSTPSVERSSRAFSPLKWLAAMVAVAVTMAVLVWKNPDHALDFSVVSIAVLPLQDLSERGEFPWLTQGIAKNLNQRLRDSGAIKVPSDLAIERAYELGETPGEIAQLLGVETLVSGYIQQVSATSSEGNGATFAIHLEVSEARSARVLWTQDVQGAQEDLLELQNHIVDLVTGFLGLRVPTPLRKPTPSTPLAYAAYLKFLYFESQNMNTKSLEWIEQTTTLEPDFAFGHLQAGWTYAEMYARTMDPAYLERTVASYQRARDLGMGSHPSWLNAWGGYLSRYESRHREAETYLRKAAEGGVVTQYVHLLLASGLYEAGRDAALHSLVQNPTQGDERAYLNIAHGLLGDYSAMLESAREALTLYPNNVLHRSHEMSALIRLDRLDEAEKVLGQLAQQSPNSEIALSFPRGRIAAARGQREEALENAALLQRHGVTASAGLIYLSLGDPRGEVNLRNALQPFYITLPFRLAAMPEAVKTNTTVLAGIHDYGYDEVWRAELCRLAATMPVSTGISCSMAVIREGQLRGFSRSKD